jgi:hypothetical protein
LTDAGQVRVWNLLLDVIVQTGLYPAGAQGPSDFLVKGERRAWVHLSMDRLTGEVLAKALEWVNE